MAINLRTPQAETRDQRLGTITQWDGSALELARDSAFTFGCGRDCGPGGKRLCEASSPYSQASMCAEQIAVTNATIIKDTVVIQHSPIGCASSQSLTSRYSRDLAARRGWKPEDPRTICTNLGEQDMVFGGVERLADTIREAFERHHPRVIFVATSCATGIIGDDVDGTASQLEKELGIPVVPLHCEGFKSRHWSSGWDVIEHGILRRLVPASVDKRDDLINVIHLGGPDVFSPLLNPLGLSVNLVMGGNPIERLAALSTASATITMCFVLSYLATGLEQEYGVPEIKAPLPYGLEATDNWLRDIARVTGRAPERVEAVIAAERARIAPELASLRAALKGKRGFVAAGAAFAHGLIADLRELGITVDDAYSFHHDPVADSRDPEQDSLGHLVQTTGDIEHFTVSPDQHFQAHAALLRAKPDFVICRHSGSMAILAARMGIPVLPIFYSNDGLGYEGLLTIGRAIKRVLPRRRFYEDVAAHSAFPYQRWWLDETDPYAAIDTAAAAE